MCFQQHPEPAAESGVIVDDEHSGHIASPKNLALHSEMKLQISVYRKGCIPKGRTSSFGILNRRHATTHWMFAKEFALRYPRVIVEPDRIYVQDGNIYTSAGVTAGMDLSLALVEEDLGSAVALQVARALVLFLRRPGGQKQDQERRVGKECRSRWSPDDEK